MKSNLKFEERDQYLYIKIEGDYNKNDFIDYIKQVSTQINTEKTKILVNGLGISGTNIPLIDRFELAEKFSRLLKYKLKLAAVWPKKDINKFGETVAINRGSRIFVTSQEEEAENWLLAANR